jgi:sarcosine oxidase gamma subunit
VPELIAKTALEGQSISQGGLQLQELDPGPITSIALFAGQEEAALRALTGAGLRFPAPNCIESGPAGARMVWTGRNQAFLIGAEVPIIEGAALTDQTSGWSCLELSGAGASDVLMRLVPLDLRLTQFPVGRAVRSGLNHMNMVLIRTAEQSFEIMVFRSMAQTAWHEINEAMSSVVARG